MKKYIKENQVYTVQEGSELEVQLMADGFEELGLMYRAHKSPLEKS